MSAGKQFWSGDPERVYEGPNVYGEGGGYEPDFNSLLDAWEAEIDEHTKAGEYGIAEGLRIASDELTEALRARATSTATDTGRGEQG